jgi:OOP family OmpA-OmpF porin
MRIEPIAVAALAALALTGCARSGGRPTTGAAAPAPGNGTALAEIPGPAFEAGRATITPAGRATVAEAAATLKANPTVRVEVAGHTDSRGSDHRNQRLSEQRARAVADELVREGIEIGRLTVRGYGEAKPVADDATESGRARNRRVEIVVD